MYHKYFNRYPSYQPSVLWNDQTSFKNAIIDFDTAMKAAGLTRSNLPGQLDVTNIPDLDSSILARNKVHPQYTSFWQTTSENYVNMSDSPCLQHLPLIYTFSDEQQSTNPIYIAFYFSLVVTTPIMTAYQHEVNFAPFVKCHVSNRSDFSNKFNFFNSKSSYNGNINESVLKVISRKDFTTESDSIISYNNEKGVLYIDLCPGICFIQAAGALVDVYYMKTSLFKILISRNEVDDTFTCVGLNQNFGGLASMSESVGNVKAQLTCVFINKNGTLEDSSLYALDNVFSKYNVMGKNQIALSPITTINNSNAQLYDPKVLIVANRNNFINNSIYEVNFENKEKYICWGTIDTNYTFNIAANKNTNTVYNSYSLLIKLGEENV